jgi:hypothetical protein
VNRFSRRAAALTFAAALLGAYVPSSAASNLVINQNSIDANALAQLDLLDYCAERRGLGCNLSRQRKSEGHSPRAKRANWLQDRGYGLRHCDNAFQGDEDWENINNGIESFVW